MGTLDPTLPIAQLVEHWVKQFHQEATAMERLWCNAPHSVQAQFRASREHNNVQEGTAKSIARVLQSILKQGRRESIKRVERKKRKTEKRMYVKPETLQLMDADAEQPTNTLLDASANCKEY